EHGNVEEIDELGDRTPVGAVLIKLFGGSGVEADGGAAFVLGDAAGVTVGQEIVVDALAEFDRDWDRTRSADRGADDRGEQLGLGWDRRAAAATGDLRDRATEVHVD